MSEAIEIKRFPSAAWVNVPFQSHHAKFRFEILGAEASLIPCFEDSAECGVSDILHDDFVDKSRCNICSFEE